MAVIIYFFVQKILHLDIIRILCRRGIEMKILLVDDASFIRMSLEKILDKSEYKFEYIEAVDGIEAIEKYKSERPDLVIMDISMPNMNGIEAVKSIKQYDNDADIIMCSSTGYPQKVIDAINAGASDFVTKPYKPEQIVDAVKVAIKRKQEN